MKNILKLTSCTFLRSHSIFDKNLIKTLSYASNLFKTNDGRYLSKPSIAYITSERFSQNNNRSNPSQNKLKIFLALFGITGVSLFTLNKNKAYCEEKETKTKNVGETLEGLPYFTEEEVLLHNKSADRIWVSFRNGVYDITSFVESHPGGDKILLAAGSSIDAFWNIYAVHKKEEVYELLESLRIGNLKKNPLKSKPTDTTTSDPFQYEPKRHPLLKVVNLKPFNAESPIEFSVENIITPNDLHFVRNHLPVPKIDINDFKLEIENELDGKKYTFTCDELKKKFQTYTIPVTLQCSGNRRKAMNEYQPIQGLMWDVNAISTAEWTGVKLKDILLDCGINLNDERIKHVKFEGLDKDPFGSAYGASIPKEKAFNENEDVIVSFKMNGVDIPPDHGYPLRVVVPGIVGARSVKWLKKISISQEESRSHWQLNDYKVVPPNIKNLKEVDFTKYKAIQESPVQSAICEPVNGTIIDKSDETFKVKGYAYSGGGKSINSVNISLDNGQTWKEATVKQLNQPLYRSWSWAIWECEIDIPKEKSEIEIVCVATDSGENTQPETVKSIWNVRGLLNNSWHKININFK